jgi:hypothetical protein
MKMTAIEVLKKELEEIQIAQCECISDSGMIIPYQRHKYQLLTRKANELKGSIDWLSKMYEGKEVINNK